MKTLQELDALLQKQIEIERKEEEERARDDAEKISEFKTGDVVRGVIQCKEQALEIVGVLSCDAFSDTQGDGVYTHYEVRAKYGRIFNLVTLVGCHPDCSENQKVTLLQSSKIN
jgi:hypothetical protein